MLRRRSAGVRTGDELVDDVAHVEAAVFLQLLVHEAEREEVAVALDGGACVSVGVRWGSREVYIRADQAVVPCSFDGDGPYGAVIPRDGLQTTLYDLQDGHRADGVAEEEAVVAGDEAGDKVVVVPRRDLHECFALETEEKHLRRCQRI